MKVVILAGGKGTRLSEYTKTIPKPMVKIGNIPILVHIINFYKKYGLRDFIIAGGYKYNVIKKYFAKKKIKNTKITVINTGINSLTGTRIKKLKKYLNETFMLTYGDGLADINLRKLYKFHKKHKKKITITAVHPPARFGELKLSGNKVISFKEKPQLQKGWINGGFFIVEPDFLKLIDKKNIMLERNPLQKATKKKILMAFKHSGFWFCMDTLRDKNVLDAIWKSKKVPWI
jgi:glucose-1-phosphate cytidylyltransferase